MTLLHSVCHHHEFVKTSHRGSHETCSTQVLTEPSLIDYLLTARTALRLRASFSPYDYAYRLENHKKGLSYTIKEEDSPP